MNSIDYERAFDQSFQIYKQHFKTLVLASLIGTLITYVTLGFAGPAMWAGIWLMCVRAMRGEQIQTGDLFEGFNAFLPLLAHGFIMWLLIIMGFALFVLPGLALMLLLPSWWFYTPILILDRRMGLGQSLGVSKEIAQSTGIWDYVILNLIFIAIFSLGASFLFGVIFALPLLGGVAARLYLDETESRPELIDGGYSGAIEV